MKNRVLRLAIVALLVVAMVLTMAACTDPVVTPTPGTTTTPTTTPDGTPSPDDTSNPEVPLVGDEAIAKSTYGIEVINVESTYANNDNFVVLKYDEKLLENYTLKNAPLSAVTTGIKFPFEVTSKVSYDGDNKFDSTALKDLGTIVTVFMNADGKYVQEVKASAAGVKPVVAEVKAPAGATFYPAVALSDAGLYEVEFSITATDLGFGFGQFGFIQADEAEYSLMGTANIAKADVVVAANDFVHVVADEAKEVGDITKVNPFDVRAFVVDTPASLTADATLKNNSIVAKPANPLLAANAVNELLAALKTSKMSFGISSSDVYDVTKVSSFELAVNLYDTDTAAVNVKDVVKIDELVVGNYNVTLENGTQHFISKYDWNVVRDTATSILERGTVATPSLPVADKVALARARYDALTDEQKVFFTSGAITTTASTDPAILVENVNIGTFTAKADFDLDALDANGIELYKLLTADEKIISDAKVVAAFDKVAVDSLFIKSFDKKFEVSNGEHRIAYDTLNAYFQALSDEDKAIVKASSTLGKDDDAGLEITLAKSAAYDKYNSVAGAFDIAAVNDVKSVINGAAAAYNTAVVKAKPEEVLYKAAKTATTVSGKGYPTIYLSTSSQNVMSITAQARTAYDKLTPSQKVVMATAPETDVTEPDCDDEFIVSQINMMKTVATYTDVLVALEMMNDVIGSMKEVVSHYAYYDLSTKSSPAFDSIDSIIRGRNGANIDAVITPAFLLTYFDGAYDKLPGYKFDATVATTDAGFTPNYINRDLAFAAEDILRAYDQDSAHMDAVVAEYKAAIDYVVAGEAFKAAAIASLNEMIAVEFSADDYSDGQTSAATSSKNDLLEAITLVITMEGKVDTTVASADDATIINLGTEFATADTILLKDIVKMTVGELLVANKGDSYAEVIEEFESLFNVDKAFDEYISVGTFTPTGTGAVAVKKYFFESTKVTFA